MSWKVEKAKGKGEGRKVLKSCTITDIAIQKGTQNKPDLSNDSTEAKIKAVFNWELYPNLCSRLFTTAVPVLARPYFKDGAEYTLHQFIKTVDAGLKESGAGGNKRLAELKNLREDYEDLKKDRQAAWLKRKGFASIEELDAEIEELESGGEE